MNFTAFNIIIDHTMNVAGTKKLYLISLKKIDDYKKKMFFIIMKNIISEILIYKYLRTQCECISFIFMCFIFIFCSCNQKFYQ